MGTSKEKVLSMLEKRRGEYLSGEEIARALAISRNAVWKAIGSLREEGFRIEASTRRGYALFADRDTLNAAQIRAAAGLGELALHIYDDIGSTNVKAKELAVLGAPHGTTVLADRQSEGSGRHLRPFFSPEGGIYLSVILRPGKLHFTDAETVTAYAAVAVRRAVCESTGKEAQIKPVNDLYMHGRKLCGILTESVSDFESGEIGWIVVGVGVNYRLDGACVPEALREKVIALYDGADEAMTPRSVIIGAILRHLLKDDLARDREDILREYRAHTIT